MAKPGTIEQRDANAPKWSEVTLLDISLIRHLCRFCQFPVPRYPPSHAPFVSASFLFSVVSSISLCAILADRSAP